MHGLRLLAVVMPAKNEASVIGRVLRAIPRDIEGMAVALIVVLPRSHARVERTSSLI
jgi:hypothetical protein